MNDPVVSTAVAPELPRLKAGKPPDLHILFHPASVAIIGASRNVKKSGGDFLNRLVERGYPGAIYPISLREKELFGLKAYSSIGEVPGSIDLAVFCIPAAGVLQAMADCAAKGVKFVIVHTSGFSEVGDSNLEAELLRLARDGGIRFVGPNCMGVFSNGARLSFMDAAPEPDIVEAEVAFIGQSGTLCDNFMLQGRESGLRVSKVVSLGNEADLRFTDYLAYFAADPQIKIIAAYMEGVREGRKLLHEAQLVTRHKPVLIWKAGKTAAGGRATLSHTGSIAGSHTLNQAAFRQVGILTAHSLQELVDLTAAFYSPLLPRGLRIGILVDTGGGAVSAADACESAGLEVTPLSLGVQQALRAGLQGQIPPFAGVTNPVDLVSPRDEDRVRLYNLCLELIVPEVDCVMIITFHDLSDASFLLALEQAQDRLGKPFFMVPAMPQREGQAIKAYTQRGIPSYYNVDRAARAIRGLVDYAGWRENR